MPYNFNMANQTPEGIFIQASNSMPGLIGAILFFEFMVISMAGYLINRSRTGYANILMWFAISGLVTTTSAFFLYLVPGLMNIETLVITVVISIVFVGIFLVQNYIINQEG